VRGFRRVLSYLRPYRVSLTGSIICTILFTLFPHITHNNYIKITKFYWLAANHMA